MISKNRIIYIIIVTFLIYAVLALMNSNGLILNIQAYIDYQIIPFVFWTFFILVCLRLLKSDIGFFKFGAILGIINAVLILGFTILDNTSDFHLVQSDNHAVIIERIGSPDPGEVHIYKRVNPLYSTYISSVSMGHYYELTYEINGDILIITRCTELSCIPIEIDLEE